MSLGKMKKSMYNKKRILTPTFCFHSGDAVKDFGNIYFGGMREDESGKINGFFSFSYNISDEDELESIPVEKVNEEDFGSKICVGKSGSKNLYLTSDGKLVTSK